jgi:hypothetical protein
VDLTSAQLGTMAVSGVVLALVAAFVAVGSLTEEHR